MERHGRRDAEDGRDTRDLGDAGDAGDALDEGREKQETQETMLMQIHHTLVNGETQGKRGGGKGDVHHVNTFR